MSVLYHPGKENVVSDALYQMTIGSVSHVEEGNKYLVEHVHILAKLGVWLEDSSKGVS